MQLAGRMLPGRKRLHADVRAEEWYGHPPIPYPTAWLPSGQTVTHVESPCPCAPPLPPLVRRARHRPAVPLGPCQRPGGPCPGGGAGGKAEGVRRQVRGCGVHVRVRSGLPTHLHTPCPCMRVAACLRWWEAVPKCLPYTPSPPPCPLPVTHTVPLPPTPCLTADL